MFVDYIDICKYKRIHMYIVYSVYKRMVWMHYSLGVVSIKVLNKYDAHGKV